jgi:hypothetical protein
MKKKLSVIVLLALMTSMFLGLHVFATEGAKPFPYEDFPDAHYGTTTAYPAWERDLRDKSGHYAELGYTVPVYLIAYKQWWTDVDHETFESFANRLAKQSADLEIYKVPGMWEAYEKCDAVSLFWDIQTYSDTGDFYAYREGKTVETQIEEWEASFQRTIDAWEDFEGTVSKSSYLDGTLVEMYEERMRGGYAKNYECYFIRPVPEVKGLYIYYHFQLNDRHQGDTYHDAEFAELKSWRDKLFSAKYEVVWRDDFEDYTKLGTHDEGVTQSAADTPGEDDGVVVSDDIVEGSGKKDSDSDKGSSKSDTVKSSHDYDDDGMGVGGAVAVGVLSTGAAVGAGAAASGKGKNNNGKKKKSYKMYVQKDFGDAIRRGVDPVKIRARMAEVDEDGIVRDRNDLTALISVSGDGMTVHSATMAGRYCEATVSVPLDNQEDTANIIFIFNGEGGSFTNTVVFRLVDGPSLKFVEETEKAGTYHLYHSGCGIEAIPGDNFTYTRQFMIVDATVAPKLTDIRAVNTGEFNVKFEMTDHQYVYKMIVKNNTKPEPEHDLFEKVKEEHFEIHVTVEGEKEPVKGYVTMEMYPEGITISSPQEGKKGNVKYVRVQAFEKENVGDFDKKWQVSQIKFTLAFKGKDKAIIDPEETEFKFAKLKGAGGLGMRADKEESLAEKYQYEEAHTWMNGKCVYEFEPQAHLCEPSDGSFMMVLLPVTCKYENVKYTAEIPLRLRGVDMDPMENWELEYKKLCERLEKYSLPAEKDRWLERIETMANDPRASVEELRLTSKMLVRNYMRYWEIEGIKSRQDAELYDNIINQLEWAKFFGDCAFSFLVNAYAGPVAEAILSPTKDFLTEAIGETIASWSRGESVDFDKFNFSKNVLAAGDNLVSGQIGFENWKKAAYTLGAYFAYASLKNFYMTLREENKFDLYGALVKGFSDMTSAGMKAAAGHLFDAWLKNNVQFRKKMSIWCGQFVTKHFGAGSLLLDLRNVEGITKSEIVRKYLDGLFGMAVDKLFETTGEIHDKIVTSENGFEIDQNGHVIIQFFFEVEGSNYDCKIDATQAVVSAASGLFGYVFELLFGEVPFAASVIEMPTDPPLPPEK